MKTRAVSRELCVQQDQRQQGNWRILQHRKADDVVQTHLIEVGSSKEESSNEREVLHDLFCRYSSVWVGL